MQIAFVNGIHIHYKLQGNGNKPIVVFSNSLGTDMRIWDRLVQRLGADFQILSYDKRGHGLSDVPPPPYTINNHINDLVGLIEHLGITRAYFCGVSVGGMIVLGLASKRPELVVKAILCDTSHKIGPLQVWDERIKSIKKGGISSLSDAVMERWFSEEFRISQPQEVAGWKNMLVQTPVDGYMGTCTAIRDADLTWEAQNLQLPVMCLCGEEDNATPPELVKSLAELIPTSTFHLIKSAGHLPGIENPDEVAEHIINFVKR